MSTLLEAVKDYIQQSLGKKLSSAKYAFGELTLEIPADQWLEVARFLRHDERLQFAQLSDLCGVDYLTYGDAEWDVTTATRSGFSRAVVTPESEADLFNFGEEASKPVANAKRFAVVAHLLSVKHNLRLRIRTWGEDDEFPVVPSLVEVWSSASWYEREAFDLFGIMFEGHPDLRRILTDYGFVGYPFRKDFPLIGQVEMRYDNELKRVIYEPVTIDPRVLVPRVIRPESNPSVAEERNV